MRYSIVKDAVYCIYCALFGSQRSDAKERTFGKSSPVSDWTNLSKFVSRHTAQTSSHHDNVRAGEEFIRVGEGNKTDVVTQLSTHHHEAIEKNRHIIKEIIKVLVFCGKQNIAIRGHTEEKSNFAALLNLQAENDSILAAHMARGDPRRKYTSPTIQNELIELCANQIRESLTKACNLSGCFGFIADEATDCATREQISICVRFFDHEKGEVCENFLGFKEAERTTGEALAEKFIQTLEDYRIEIGKMRGQGYDGAANMAGIHRGVQARIRERIPLATYTHCRAHSLNLAIVHACKEPLIRNLMDTVQTIAFAFDYSAKRLLKFEESLELNADAKEAMERKTKLKTLCETRWFSRVDALSTFLKCYGVVMSSLQELADDGDSKARSYVCSIRQFDFIVALVTAEHVLTPVNPLSALLQGKSQDLLEAVKECRAVINVLREERSDDSVWDAIYAKSVEIGTKHDVAATVPRVVARQRHRGNAPANTPSEYWKRNLYLPFVDHLITELTDRLVINEDRFSAQYLIPSELSGLTAETITRIHETFGGDIPASDKQEFEQEVQRWKARWNIHGDKPATLADTLRCIRELTLYPNIYRCIEILLCMPASSASAERSFSVMRRLKTYLRATMGGERMSSLALLHAYREREIDIDMVVSEFAMQKPRRLAFVFE